MQQQDAVLKLMSAISGHCCREQWNSELLLKYGLRTDGCYLLTSIMLGGTPDYNYYAISKVLQYNQHSLAGVIYGENATAFDLTKSVTIPANAAIGHDV